MSAADTDPRDPSDPRDPRHPRDARQAAARTVVTTVVVEHELRFTLPDLARASQADVAWLRALVDEGALQPLAAPSAPPDETWFGPEALRRARLARRLVRDFELGPPEAALVMDLLDRIDDLRRQLAAAGR